MLIAADDPCATEGARDGLRREALNARHLPRDRLLDRQMLHLQYAIPLRQIDNVTDDDHVT